MLWSFKRKTTKNRRKLQRLTKLDGAVIESDYYDPTTAEPDVDKELWNQMLLNETANALLNSSMFL
jgi:hypothetical protein